MPFPYAGGMETIAAAVAVVAAAIAALGWLWRMVRGRLDPYRSDYPAIERLGLGVQSAFIAGRFGPAYTCSDVNNTESGIATIDDASASGEPKAFRLEVYRSRNAVIALLLDSSHAMSGYAVASCDRKFRAQVHIPFGTSIVLNKTKMADVELQPFERNYSVGGSGGFGYFVMNMFFGQTTAASYKNVCWGQMYLCSNPSIADELRAAHEPEELDVFRRKWEVNAVLITDNSVTPAGAHNFVLDVEGATYDARAPV